MIYVPGPEIYAYRCEKTLPFSYFHVKNQFFFEGSGVSGCVFIVKSRNYEDTHNDGNRKSISRTFEGK